MEAMVTWRVVSLTILAIGLRGQVARADDNSLRPFEQQLTAVLEWEILWKDSPNGFQIPPKGSARFALHWTSSSLSYCSRDVNVCVRYRIEPHRNWQGTARSKRDGSQSDEDALQAFDGMIVRKPDGKVAIGLPGGVTGSPTPSSGILWTTTIHLLRREEIIRKYRQMHPAEIEGLKAQILDPMTHGTAVKSITIACFASSDPMVYYYVDRFVKGSVIMAVFWDSELQKWVVASSLERSQGREKFEEMYRTIESVACSTISAE
jgi:hypothetical protein